jgi:hypothetical protein
MQDKDFLLMYTNALNKFHPVQMSSLCLLQSCSVCITQLSDIKQTILSTIQHEFIEFTYIKLKCYEGKSLDATNTNCLALNIGLIA